jgi:hypothetical protein
MPKLEWNKFIMQHKPAFCVSAKFSDQVIIQPAKKPGAPTTKRVPRKKFVDGTVMPTANQTINALLRKIVKGAYTLRQEHSGSVQVAMFADRADAEAFRKALPSASPWKAGDDNPCRETSFGIFDWDTHERLARGVGLLPPTKATTPTTPHRT